MCVVIEQKIERKGTGFNAKEWAELLKEGWELVGKFWHRVILPKHFTIAGAQEYGYEKRTNEHMSVKARKYGHQRPLVFTGDLEVAAHRTRDVRVTPKAATIVIHGPRYLYQYRKDLREPDKAKELAAISETDGALCARVLDKHIERAMKRRGKIVNITSGHRRAA